MAEFVGPSGNPSPADRRGWRPRSRWDCRLRVGEARRCVPILAVIDRVAVLVERQLDGCRPCVPCSGRRDRGHHAGIFLGSRHKYQGKTPRLARYGRPSAGVSPADCSVEPDHAPLEPLLRGRIDGHSARAFSFDGEPSKPPVPLDRSTEPHITLFASLVRLRGNVAPR